MWNKSIESFSKLLSCDDEQLKEIQDAISSGAKIVYVLRRRSSFELRFLEKFCILSNLPLPGRVFGSELRGVKLQGGEAEVLFLRDRRGHESLLTWVRSFRSMTLGFCGEIVSRKDSGENIVLVPLSFFAGKGPRPFPARSLLPIDFSFLRLLDFWSFVVFSSHKKSLTLQLNLFEMPPKTPASKLLRSLSRQLYRQEKLMRGAGVTKSQTVESIVLNDERVEKGISELAVKTTESRAQLYDGARKRLNEIAATMRGGAIRVIYAVVKPVISTVFQKIDVRGIEKLRKAALDHPTVILPSHKSHFDYLLVGWILYHANIPMPYVAAGSNLNFFPVGNVFKAAGAFFIRRKIGKDKLYKLVLDSYLSYLIKRGHLIAFYIEGGRSRSGAMRYPRLGLLKYLIRGWISGGRDDIQFVPIGISYETLAEEKALVRERVGGAKNKESLFELFRLKGIWKKRFGEASFSVGEPFSLKDFLKSTQDVESSKVNVNLLTEDLAFAVSRRIMEQTMLTGSSLVSLALCTFSSNQVSIDELTERMKALVVLYCIEKGEKSSVDSIEAFGFDPALDSLCFGYQLRTVMQNLPPTKAMRSVVKRFENTGYGSISDDDVFQLKNEKILAIDYYKNNMMFAFVRFAILTQTIASGCDNTMQGVYRYHQLFKPLFLFEHWRFWEDSFLSFVEDLKEKGLVVSNGKDSHALTSKGKELLPHNMHLFRPFFEALLAAIEILEAYKGEQVLRSHTIESVRLRLKSPNFLSGNTRPETIASSYIEFAVDSAKREVRKNGPQALGELKDFVVSNLNASF